MANKSKLGALLRKSLSAEKKTVAENPITVSMPAELKAQPVKKDSIIIDKSHQSKTLCKAEIMPTENLKLSSNGNFNSAAMNPLFTFKLNNYFGSKNLISQLANLTTDINGLVIENLALSNANLNNYLQNLLTATDVINIYILKVFEFWMRRAAIKRDNVYK